MGATRGDLQRLRGAGGVPDGGRGGGWSAARSGVRRRRARSNRRERAPRGDTICSGGRIDGQKLRSSNAGTNTRRLYAGASRGRTVTTCGVGTCPRISIVSWRLGGSSAWRRAAVAGRRHAALARQRASNRLQPGQRARGSAGHIRLMVRLQATTAVSRARCPRAHRGCASPIRSRSSPAAPCRSALATFFWRRRSTASPDAPIPTSAVLRSASVRFAGNWTFFTKLPYSHCASPT